MLPTRKLGETFAFIPLPMGHHLALPSILIHAPEVQPNRTVQRSPKHVLRSSAINQPYAASKTLTNHQVRNNTDLESD
jgi:hypothetical protein